MPEFQWSERSGGCSLWPAFLCHGAKICCVSKYRLFFCCISNFAPIFFLNRSEIFKLNTKAWNWKGNSTVKNTHLTVLSKAEEEIEARIFMRAFFINAKILNSLITSIKLTEIDDNDKVVL